MRNLPLLEAKWRSGDFTGDQRRPMVRATVQVPKMALRHYSVMTTFRPIAAAPSGTDSLGDYAPLIDPYHGRKVTQTYADFMFTPPNFPKELTNIRSLSWSRSLDQDAATMTLELYNSKPRPETDPIPNPLPTSRRDLDYPGWYTFDRGHSSYSNRWAHAKNEWLGMLMPDNIIRTFEGYGMNSRTSPEYDRNLAQTGVWMIDTVQYSALGIIVVNCRDLARLLLDHQVNRPVIPADFNELHFRRWQDKVLAPPTKTRLPMRANDHSNRYGPAKGQDGQLHPITSPWNYRGHTIEDALDDDPATYWMSFSHIKPRWPWGAEWVEFSFAPTASVANFQLWTVGSGYTCYVSLFANGHWLNAAGDEASDSDPHIRWTPNPTNPNRNQQARRPYVKSFVVGPDFAKRLKTVTLPKTYATVEKIRLTFVNLQQLPGIKPKGGYRAGVRSIRCFGPDSSKETSLRKGPAGSNPGRYGDYTDIVKLACAWAGFYWPRGGSQKTADGRTYQPYYTHKDWDLGTDGRVWGDFEPTGTTGPAELTPDQFQNKTLMDVVSMVRDIVDFVFFVDEVGAVQWRLPNIYMPGNWLNDEHMNAVRSGRVLQIDEKQVILALDATLNSGSIREVIRVTNFIDTREAPGFVPNYVGLRRVLLWAEPKFEKGDLQRAADMTAVRSLFTWRRDRLVIPGYPGLQLDDQVQIFERVTGEGFIHYVRGISSNNSLDTGEWTYTIDTQWLGDKQQVRWVVPPEDIPARGIYDATTKYLRPQYRKQTDPV